MGGRMEMALGVPGGLGRLISGPGTPPRRRTVSWGCPGAQCRGARWGARAAPRVPGSGRGSERTGQVRRSRSVSGVLEPVSMDTDRRGEARLLLYGDGVGVRDGGGVCCWCRRSEGAGARLERLGLGSGDGVACAMPRAGWGGRCGAV